MPPFDRRIAGNIVRKGRPFEPDSRCGMLSMGTRIGSPAHRGLRKRVAIIRSNHGSLLVEFPPTREERMPERIATPCEVADPQPTVVPYREDFRPAFEQLNRDWIESYFVLEDADRAVFADPAGAILGPGGQIFFVVEGDTVLGTCAVLRHGAGECEIAKMAVAPAARGRGLGDLLMEAAVDFARQIGARRVTIISNTVLAPALRLYRKHGFVEVPLESDGRYQRANIRLERELGVRESVERRGEGE